METNKLENKLKNIRKLLPTSSNELEQLIRDDLDACYREWEHDISSLGEIKGCAVIANTLALYHWSRALRISVGEEKLVAAYHLAESLQFNVVETVYDYIDVFDYLIHDPTLYEPLAIILVMHMIIPKLQYKLPANLPILIGADVKLGQRGKYGDKCHGPLTLYQKFKTIKTIGLKNTFFDRIVDRYIDQNYILLLLDLFNKLKSLSANLQLNQNQVLSDILDLSTQVGTPIIFNEVVTVVLLPQLRQLWTIQENADSNVSQKARFVIQIIINNGLLDVPLLITDETIRELVSQCFCMPDGLMSNEMKRIHYDIMFEALDNSSRCFQSGSFVRYLSISVACLENSVSDSYGMFEYNRIISALSPPLSSLAIFGHLIYETSRTLDEMAGDFCAMAYMETIFKRHLPPIPLRHFANAQTPSAAQVVHGMDTNGVQPRLLISTLNSLVNMMYKNIEFYGDVGLDGIVEDSQFTVDSLTMAVCSLFCAAKHSVDTSNIVQTLLKMMHSYPRLGMLSLINTSSDLSLYSIKYSGIGIQLIADVLIDGDPQYMAAQVNNCSYLMSNLVREWHKTTSVSMKILIEKLHQIGCRDVITYALQYVDNVDKNSDEALQQNDVQYTMVPMDLYPLTQALPETDTTDFSNTTAMRNPAHVHDPGSSTGRAATSYHRLPVSRSHPSLSGL